MNFIIMQMTSSVQNFKQKVQMANFLSFNICNAPERGYLLNLRSMLSTTMLQELLPYVKAYMFHQRYVLTLSLYCLRNQVDVTRRNTRPKYTTLSIEYFLFCYYSAYLNLALLKEKNIYTLILIGITFAST